MRKLDLDLSQIIVVDDSEDLPNAFEDITPIEWDDEILEGRKQVVIDASYVEKAENGLIVNYKILDCESEDE